jgi:hypothetical protein
VPLTKLVFWLQQQRRQHTLYMSDRRKHPSLLSSRSSFISVWWVHSSRYQRGSRRRWTYLHFSKRSGWTTI